MLHFIGVCIWSALGLAIALLIASTIVKGVQDASDLSRGTVGAGDSGKDE